LRLKSAGEPSQRASQQRHFLTGGVFWTKFEHFLSKTRIPNFKIQSLGRTKRKGAGGKEFLPALAFPPPPNFVPTKLARRRYFSNLHAFTNSYPNWVNPIILYVLNCTGYSPILTPPKEAGG